MFFSRLLLRPPLLYDLLWELLLLFVTDRAKSDQTGHVPLQPAVRRLRRRPSPLADSESSSGLGTKPTHPPPSAHCAVRARGVGKCGIPTAGRLRVLDEQARVFAAAGPELDALIDQVSESAGSRATALKLRGRLRPRRRAPTRSLLPVEPAAAVAARFAK